MLRKHDTIYLYTYFIILLICRHSFKASKINRVLFNSLLCLEVYNFYWYLNISYILFFNKSILNTISVALLVRFWCVIYRNFDTKFTFHNCGGMACLNYNRIFLIKKTVFNRNIKGYLYTNRLMFTFHIHRYINYIRYTQLEEPAPS